MGIATDTSRSILVIIATIGVIAFNWLAAIGRVNGTTPEVVSARYPTPITPAGFAFTIWSLIYLGLIAFSIYQALPKNRERFRSLRTIYILSCVLNCAWIWCWHHDMIGVCMGVILALLGTLLWINVKLRVTDSYAEYWAASAPFSLYFGWVTAASIVNFAVLLKYLDVQMSASASMIFGAVCIFAAAALAVVVRIRLRNYLYPMAVAWALTGIGVKQSGQTLVVAAAAVGLVACLIATCSFVMNLNSSISPRTTNE